MIEPPRLLVTGASGFLGAHIVSRARALGCDVVAATRRVAKGDGVVMDVCSAGTVDAAFRIAAPSIVIHCAAYGVNYAEQDFDRALAINVRGALCVMAAAARFGVRRFVHVGTAVEYGNHSGCISEDAALRPTAIYGTTKAAATLLIQERAKALDLPLLVVRPFPMWGPGEGMAFLIPQVVDACITRSPLQLTACEVIRDYSYVEDIAADIVALALAGEDLPHVIFNLGTGRGLVLRDFVVAIARLFDGAALMQFGALPYRRTEIQSLVGDTTRVRNFLGPRPVTPIAEGVRRMIAWRGLPDLAAQIRCDDGCVP